MRRSDAHNTVTSLPDNPNPARTVKPGRVVHDLRGRFYRVLSASSNGMIIRELRRKLSGPHRPFGADFLTGYLGPDRSAFIAGSKPVRIPAPALKPWYGGRLPAVWIRDIDPETCSPDFLGAVSLPTDYRMVKIPFPGETLQEVAA